MSTSENLLARIEMVISSTPEMTATSFGRDALGDPNLVFDLRKGRLIRKETTLKRINDFVDKCEKQPEGT